MKALLLLALVVLAVVVVVALVRAAAARSRRPGRWALEERTEGDEVVVACVRSGTGERLTVGAAAFADDAFSLRIEELRSAGRERLVALNAPRD